MKKEKEGEAPRPFVRYLRDNKRRPIATAVFWKSNQGPIMAGWSKRHKGDDFDRKEGMVTAYRRGVAMAALEATLDVAPTGIRRFMLETAEMAARYFDGPKPAKRRARKAATRA